MKHHAAAVLAQGLRDAQTAPGAGADPVIEDFENGIRARVPDEAQDPSS